MKLTNLLRLFIVGICLYIANASADVVSNLTPEGKWIQYDDVTKKPHSVIQIYAKDGKFFGKILETFSINGKPPRKYCDLCQGALYNAPIIGLGIMNNFKQLSSKVWGDGTILDPSSGKIYSCKLTLSDDGKTMDVRGFIGISLLGRSQIWLKQ